MAEARLMSTPKMAEVCAGLLRSQIARGGLIVGDALPSEKELIEMFGISRPTLREALRILESEGLLRIHRGARGGAVVTTPDVSVAARQVGLLLQLDATTLGDVYEARSLVELSAVGMLASRHHVDDVKALRAQIEITRAVADEGIKFAEAASGFHLAIVERSGNQTLWLVARLLGELTVDTYLRALTAPQRYAAATRKSLRSYEVLVDHIEAGDQDKAEDHWRRHMTTIAKGPVLSDPEAKVDVDRLAEVGRLRREAGLAVQSSPRGRAVS